MMVHNYDTDVITQPNGTPSWGLSLIFTIVVFTASIITLILVNCWFIGKPYISCDSRTMLQLFQMIRTSLLFQSASLAFHNWQQLPQCSNTISISHSSHLRHRRLAIHKAIWTLDTAAPKISTEETPSPRRISFSQEFYLRLNDRFPSIFPSKMSLTISYFSSRIMWPIYCNFLFLMITRSSTSFPFCEVLPTLFTLLINGIRNILRYTHILNTNSILQARTKCPTFASMSSNGNI